MTNIPVSARFARLARDPGPVTDDRTETVPSQADGRDSCSQQCRIPREWALRTRDLSGANTRSAKRGQVSGREPDGRGASRLKLDSSVRRANPYCGHDFHSPSSGSIGAQHVSAGQPHLSSTFIEIRPRGDTSRPMVQFVDLGERCRTRQPLASISEHRGCQPRTDLTLAAPPVPTQLSSSGRNSRGQVSTREGLRACKGSNAEKEQQWTPQASTTQTSSSRSIKPRHTCRYRRQLFTPGARAAWGTGREL